MGLGFVFEGVVGELVWVGKFVKFWDLMLGNLFGCYGKLCFLIWFLLGYDLTFCLLFVLFVNLFKI